MVMAVVWLLEWLVVMVVTDGVGCGVVVCDAYRHFFFESLQVCILQHYDMLVTFKIHHDNYKFPMNCTIWSTSTKHYCLHQNSKDTKQFHFTLRMELVLATFISLVVHLLLLTVSAYNDPSSVFRCANVTALFCHDIYEFH